MSTWIEPFRSALASLAAHKLRSALTVLGVVIGVGTIIAMQAVVAGLQGTVTDELSMLGANTFQIQKHGSVQIGGGDPHQRDRERADLTLEHSRGIASRGRHVHSAAAEVYSFTGTVGVRGAHTDPNVLIAGGEEAYATANGLAVDNGRFINRSDVQRHARVAVLGTDIVKRLFPYTDPLGAMVRINARPYEVIGVFEERGSAFGRSKDNIAVLPITAFQDVFGADQSVNITVQAASPAVLSRTQDEVIGILRMLRGVRPGEPNDFEVWSSSSLVDQFNELTAVVRGAAIGIASISLLVAGIGIMNIMMVSVTERTREIGIRKAVGATSGHVLRQFLVEAVLLTELGGVIGVALGAGIGLLVRLATPLPVELPVLWVPGAFVFCSIIGVVFGVYPAARAARLDPIGALHYE